MSGATAAVTLPRPALILWRHVIRELLPPTLLSFTVFTFLLLMRYLLEISQLWIQYGAELSSVLSALVYSLPHVVVLTLPMSVLVGGLVAFGRMSADFEVVAMRALGISLLQLVPPVLAFGALMGGINAWIFMVALPAGNQALIELQWDTMTQRALGQEVKPRVFHDSFPGLVLYLEDVVDQGSEWRGVFAARIDDGDAPPTIIRAERGYPIVDEEARSTHLLLSNGTVIRSAADPREVTVTEFEEQTMLVWSEERDSLLGGPGTQPRAMTLAQLWEAIGERSELGDPGFDLLVEVHKRYAFPVACIVLALISIPLGISTRRQTTAIGYAIGTAVIVVYYWFVQNGEQQGDVGAIPPWLGMWSGNIVLGVAAMVLLWRKSRELDFGIVRALRRVVEDLAGKVTELVRVHVLHRRARTDEGRGHRGGFPRLLDRYVLQTYGAIYCLTFVALVVVFTVASWLDKATYVEFPEMIPAYLAFYVFQIIFDVIPIAAVITVLATFSLMSRTSEITAALAGGVSLYRLVAPILAPALVLSAAHYALQDYVVPYTSSRAHEIEQEMDPEDGPAIVQSGHRWVFSPEGRRVFHFAEFLESPPRFRGLQVYYLGDSPDGIARMEFADLAMWSADGSRWEAHNGWRRFFVPRDGREQGMAPTTPEQFRFQVLPIPEGPEYFGRAPRQPAEMSTADLVQEIRRLEEQGYETDRALVDFHLKISFPAITLVMTLVGIPFAFRMGRQGALTGIGIGIGLVILYWIAFGVFRALGYAGTLPPILAAWAPHLLFFALAGYQALGLRT